jgi:hypothetical protein
MKLAISQVTAKPNFGGTLSVHTLEQVRHTLLSQGFQKPQNGIIELKKKAKNTYFSKELARNLTTLTSPLHKAYKRTLFDCCNTMMQEGRKITSPMYCGYRWCNTCNRIRTGKLINGYMPILKMMNEPYFVTLTIPNVKDKELRAALSGMIQTSKNVMLSLKRLKMPVNGIRKIECTYNAKEDTYHPHLHFIVNGKNVAENIVNKWIERYSYADRKGQDYRAVNTLDENEVNGMKELFKYTTKIITKVQNEGYLIYLSAIDRIFRSMKGMRTFQPIGNIKKVDDELTNLDSQEYDVEPYEFVVWKWEKNDWQNMTNGKMLSNYKPDKYMKELLNERIVI